MTGAERLKQLGLNPKVIWFTSPGGRDYTFYWNANAAYDSEYDCFRMLQHSGTYGGRGVKWVKARNLVKWKQQDY